MRKSGILFPIFSLPSAYGIGGFSEEAYHFVDFLCEAGQAFWQILPLGQTSFGDSPYQAFSSFAGNPYFIDLVTLKNQGLLTEEDLTGAEIERGREIPYETLFYTRRNLLFKAYRAFKKQGGETSQGYQAFVEGEADWLRDYCLFMTLKDLHGGLSWNHFAEVYKKRDEKALTNLEAVQKDNVGFYRFIQYAFACEWRKLKAYAGEKGIEIIGDIPIYVAYDSADVWAHPDLFELDKDGLPKRVAGCPPDGFSADGQLWGNPLYDWARHQNQGYAWWKRRIEKSLENYDIVRIDHFRGIASYYAIPYGERTAKNGVWEKGPGVSFVNALNDAFGHSRFIAEDLGFLTQDVKELLKASGYPGMKILQFAFDAREESDYLPHNYERHTVCYTGTHDNDTTASWLEKMPETDRAFLEVYMHKKDITPLDLVAMAQRSVADMCIIPLQDYLCLGERARINTPSTLGGNWNFILKDESYRKCAADVKKLTKACGR